MKYIRNAICALAIVIMLACTCVGFASANGYQDDYFIATHSTDMWSINNVYVSGSNVVCSAESKAYFISSPPGQEWYNTGVGTGIYFKSSKFIQQSPPLSSYWAPLTTGQEVSGNGYISFVESRPNDGSYYKFDSQHKYNYKDTQGNNRYYSVTLYNTYMP